MDPATLYLIEYQDGYVIAAAGQTVEAALADAYAVTERDPGTIARICLHATGEVVAGGSTVPDGFVPVEPHKDTFPGPDDAEA